MAKFLSSDWVEQVEPLLEGMVDGVQVVVTGGPDGDVHLGRTDAPALVLTTTADVARELIDGVLDVNVAYMQGRLKTAGDNALLLQLLPKTRSEAFTRRRNELRALTD